MSDNGLPMASNQGNQGMPVATNNTATSTADEIAAENSTVNDIDSQDFDEGVKQNRFLAFFTDKSITHRLILLGILVIFLTVSIFTVLSFTGSSNEVTAERTLGQYSSQNIGQVLDYLDVEGYKYKLAGNNTIVVEAEDYPKITEGMLRQGIALPKENTDDGDNIIMSDSGFGVSQRMENERIKHGREVQLARAIERIDGIERATVLLAIPKDNVFAREKSRPSAAVVVTLKQNAYLSPENVNSIRFLVSSSVHNLLSKDVSVTDQQGRQLSAEVRTNTEENKIQREFELRTMREAQYRDKLDSILMPMLGLGNYSAEVDVTLDTTRQEETSQLFNPDSQTVRSETLREKIGGDDNRNPAGVPGSLSNQPPANASIPQELKDGTGLQGQSSSTSQQKEEHEAVRNYEVDQVTRHTVRQTNTVSRLTVSVAVDYVRKVNADGLVTYEPRPREDLDKIADLVRGGLGLVKERGDFVHVETVSFPHTDDLPPVPWYETDNFYRLVRIGASALVFLAIIFFILRPLINKLLHKEESEIDRELEEQEEMDMKPALEGVDDFDLIARNSEISDQVYTINHEGGIELPNLRRSSDLLNTIRTLASNEPQLTAEVIKSWVEEEIKEKD